MYKVSCPNIIVLGFSEQLNFPYQLVLVYDESEDETRKNIEKSLKKEFIYSDFFNKQGKNIKKEFQENIDKGRKILENIFNNDQRVEARPMNDDIAMLNTDTGVTNTVSFITNQPTA